MTHPHSNNISAIIRRRFAFILGITLAGATTTFLSLQTLPPLYKTNAQILFNISEKSALHTHIEVLQSPTIIKETLIRQSMPPDLSQTIGKNLNIRPAGQASILNLTYQDTNPMRAANILNTLSEIYINQNNTQNATPSDENTRKFLVALKSNIDKANSALEDFQIKTTARARANSKKTHEAYEQAKHRLMQAQNALIPFQTKEGNLNMNADAILDTPSVAILIEEKHVLLQKRPAFSQRYGPKHPRVQEIDKQLSKINQQIKQKSLEVIQTIISEHDQAQKDLELLENEGMQRSLEEEAARFKESEQQLETLKSRLNEAEKLYQTFLKIQEKAILARSGAIKLLTPAQIPATPSFPNIPLLTSFAALASLIASIIIAVTRERRRPGFISARQIEETLELGCYGLIPKATPDKKRPIADFVLDNPSDPVSEAIRTLKLNLKLHTENTESETKVITLTSSFAGEGKTTLATWLARLSAKSGTRTILIDADLRRPSIHLAMGKQSKTALSDYLSGTHKLEDVIDTSDKSGLHVIYARPTSSGALDLLSGEKMDALLRNLRKTYDLIIIDTPACMSVPDARALEKRSDLFLYCIAWNKTPRDLARTGLQQFLKFSKPTLATVLTLVNPKKQVTYGYGTVENTYISYEKP